MLTAVKLVAYDILVIYRTAQWYIMPATQSDCWSMNSQLHLLPRDAMHPRY